MTAGSGLPSTTTPLRRHPGEQPFVGDVDGDGIDEPALHRESTGLVYFRNTHTTGKIADRSFIFGDPGDVVVFGGTGRTAASQQSGHSDPAARPSMCGSQILRESPIRRTWAPKVPDHRRRGCRRNSRERHPWHTTGSLSSPGPGTAVPGTGPSDGSRISQPPETGLLFLRYVSQIAIRMPTTSIVSTIDSQTAPTRALLDSDHPGHVRAHLRGPRRGCRRTPRRHLPADSRGLLADSRPKRPSRARPVGDPRVRVENPCRSKGFNDCPRVELRGFEPLTP